jgi:uncharacterized membrane protein YadS
MLGFSAATDSAAANRQNATVIKMVRVLMCSPVWMGI